jgi:TRAP-type mannitol/chloroaromatic compound transport system permease large subunit
MRRELWFGLTLMALVVLASAVLLARVETVTSGHLGLLMLALVVVAIMLGFPTAFTLMGMGMVFGWFAYRSVNPDIAVRQILDLMVQRTYAVMANDVLIAVPLFVFMGYLVERANLIEKLFKSLHLAMARVPGSLAVATIVTCAVFATATGIVGAVVTLMGLLAFPAMLRAGYNVKVGAGSITAGGCLGILIPPSVLLIVYGATAGVSVVQLYAGAFFPGLMLAALYVGYVIVLAKTKPALMPPLPEEERRVVLPRAAAVLAQTGKRALPRLLRALKGPRNADVPLRTVVGQLFVTLLPALAFAAVMGLAYRSVTAPVVAVDIGELQAMGFADEQLERFAREEPGGLQEPPNEEADAGLQEPQEQGDAGLQEPPQEEGAAETALQEPPGAAKAEAAPPAAPGEAESAAAGAAVPLGFWITLAVGSVVLVAYYVVFDFARLEVFKMLLSSFFPLAVLILAVLGSIVFGLATPSEAAAAGALGGLLLAAAYGQLNFGVVKESVFLTAKTSAMVCWLFVGSSIFSASFALLGGQEIIERWVLSLGLSPLQFLLLSQVIIFLLGWPLEWTEIIVIFMPIFIPLLDNFGIDPLFFGLLVALNLQTAFLSPPVAMSAFYLKGVSPPHVTLNQIFAGMLPFMGLQVLAIFILYMFPGIGLWLPGVLYGR